jgi:hypothetical protein
VGDAAEYFDPDSSEALDDAIDRVLPALKTTAVYRKLQLD